MKRIHSLILVLITCFLSGNCQESSQNTIKPDKITIPFNPVLNNMGEPSGVEIEEYSFYMVFYYVVPFQQLEIFSIRAKNDTAYAYHKIAQESDIKYLSEEVITNTAVSYQTFFRSYRKADIYNIKQLAANLKINDLLNTKGKVETALHGVYLGLLIYDEGKLVIVERLGFPDKCETNLIDFFDTIKQKYF